MTLDEQIAWLERRACEALRCARYADDDAWGQTDREEAAMLLAVENTLRAMRNPDPAIGCVAGMVSEL